MTDPIDRKGKTRQASLESLAGCVNQRTKVRSPSETDAYTEYNRVAGRSKGGSGAINVTQAARTSNIEHPTTNVQCLMVVGCSMLDVGCWMFRSGTSCLRPLQELALTPLRTGAN